MHCFLISIVSLALMLRNLRTAEAQSRVLDWNSFLEKAKSGSLAEFSLIGALFLVDIPSLVCSLPEPQFASNHWTNMTANDQHPGIRPCFFGGGSMCMCMCLLQLTTRS